MDYRDHMRKLLESMSSISSSLQFVIVCVDQKEESIKRSELNESSIEICTKENFWEYTSIMMLAKYIDHKDVQDDSYMLLHDTCWVENPNVFLQGMKTMNETMSSKSVDFVYPSTHIRKNVGLMSKEGVSSFGKYLLSIPKEKQTKKLAIQLEEYIEKSMKYTVMNGYTHMGIKRIDGKQRRVHYFPCISLYKHNGVVKSLDSPDILINAYNKTTRES